MNDVGGEIVTKGSSSPETKLIDEDMTREFTKDTFASTADKMSSVRPLPFNLSNFNTTPTFDAMNPHLNVLEDEHSSYLSVSKACLFLNQLASYGSSSVTPPSPGVIESNLFEANEYTTNFARILNTLSSTSSNHSDRRCRILALNSLSLVSKAVVAKLITTAVFLNHDDVVLITRLQDEIYNDTVMNMISCGLEDDDGVAAVAFESLGRLVIDLDDDPFTKDVRTITGQCTPLVFTPLDGLFENRNHGSWDDYVVSAGGTQDLDGVVYNSEIRFRILSILAPRIRTIFNRIQLMKTTECRLRCMAFLNEAVMFVCRLKKRGEEKPKDKDTFANRWYESDTDTMVQEYVDLFLIPLLSIYQYTEGVHVGNRVEAGVSTATNALMLCSVVDENETWLEHVIPLAIHNLDMGLQYTRNYGSMLELMNVMGALLVALRGVTLEIRRPVLDRVISIVADLPSTRVLPPQVIAPSLRQGDGSQRTPLRIGFWTEVALSLLLADRNTVKFSNEEYAPAHFKKAAQVNALSAFLESSTPLSLIKSKEKDQKGIEAVAIHPAEEMVFSFCSVTENIGKMLKPHISMNGENGETLIHTSMGLRQEIWVGTALILLQSFMPCLSWISEVRIEEEINSSREEPSTLLYAAQKAYIELLTSVLVHSGSIIPSSSIYHHFILSKINADANDILSSESSPLKNAIIENDAAIILDKVMKQFTLSIASRKIRLSLLCLLTDAWIQHCQRAMSMNYHSLRDDEGPVDLDNDIININESHAQNLLSYLGSEISNLIDEEKEKPTGVAGEELRSLLACIACVESIAYTAQLSANHLNSTEGNSDDEESARYLVSVSMVVLKGQGKIETDDNETEPTEEVMSSEASASQGSVSSSPFRSPRSRARITAFTSECADAAKRLRRFVGLNDDGSEIEIIGPVSIDFSSPLLKRPNFGVPFDKTDFQHILPPSQINNQWKVADRITIVDCYSKDADIHCAPLGVSASFFMGSNSVLDENHVAYGALLQLCRQQVALQTKHAIQSRSYCDWKSVESHPKYLRGGCLLRAPELQARRSTSNGVGNQEHREIMLETITGCSDPLSVTLTYSVRRQPRFDGETSFISCLTMRIQNITPVSVTNGLHLNLRLVPKSQFGDARASWNTGKYNVDVLHSNELKGGQCLTWEILFDSCRIQHHDITASVTLRDVETDTSSTVLLSTTKEDMEQRRDESNEVASHMTNVRYVKKIDFEHAEMARSLLLPNPQVFFFGRDCGDDKAFIFLWQNLQHSLPMIHIPGDETVSSLFACFSDSSSFEIRCGQGQQSMMAWALTSCFDGKHLLAISTIPGTEVTGTAARLYTKSDDLQLLEHLIS